MVQVCLLNDPAKNNKITWVPELLTRKIDQDQRKTLAEILAAENGPGRPRVRIEAGLVA